MERQSKTEGRVIRRPKWSLSQRSPDGTAALSYSDLYLWLTDPKVQLSLSKQRLLSAVPRYRRWLDSLIFERSRESALQSDWLKRGVIDLRDSRGLFRVTVCLESNQTAAVQILLMKGEEGVGRIVLLPCSDGCYQGELQRGSYVTQSLLNPETELFLL